MKRYTKIGIIVWLIALLLPSNMESWAEQAVFQQGNPDEMCDELQVVLIVDQSLSMSAKIENAPASDPQGLRFYGPKRAVETLSALRYQSYQNAAIRVAMVYFGDKPRLALPWTDLNATNKTEHQQLMAELAPSFEPVKHMGNTNFLAPFQTASTLFNQMTPQVDGCPLRAVILITDGRPSLLTKGFDWTEHMKELNRYVKQYMPPPDHQIYVIGLDRKNNYWDEVKPYWDEISGDPNKVVRAKDQAHMASLLFQFLGETTSNLRPSGSEAKMECVAGSKVSVAPFLQELRLSLTKPDPDLHLEVMDENGQPLEPSRQDVAVEIEGYDEPIETMIVTNPPPGVWTIRTMLPPETDEEHRCRIRKISFNAVGQLVSPDPTAGDRPIQFTKMPIVFRVVDTSGQPLPEYGDPLYALHVDASLQGPSQNSQDLVLDVGAQYEYQGETIPLEAGMHSLHITATSHNPDGSEFQVFDESIASIRVMPVQLVKIEGPGNVVKQYSETSLKAAIVVTGQQPVQLDLPVTVSATLNHEGEAQPLNVSLNQDGIYEATFRADQAGRYTLNYQATVDSPQGTILLGKDQIPFEVFPTTLVGAKFTSPEEDQFIATDLLLRPTGLAFEVQMVDGEGRDLGPGQVGAANPMAVFAIKVWDQDHNDRSAEFKVTNTGKPGLFRIESDTLGPGTYEVQVLPATTLGDNYMWAADSWSRTFKGRVNPLFYALLAADIGLGGIIALLIWRWIRLRRHPLSGYIRIWQDVAEITEDDTTARTYQKPIYRQDLPRKNRAVLRVSNPVIKKVIVVCPSDEDSKAGRAKATVKFKSGSPKEYPLDPGKKVDLGQGFHIEKGPPTRSEMFPEEEDLDDIIAGISE